MAGRVRGKTKLDKWLMEWQVRLGLGNWLIDIEFDAEGLEERGRCAEIEWQTDRSRATITMRHPRWYVSDGDSAEETIVHELLHLRLDGHREMEKADTSLPRETAINAMAEEYLNRKYRGKRPIERF